MLDRCKYVNHKGEVIKFGEPPYFLNASNLRDYEWSIIFNHSERVTGYKKELQEKKLPVFILKTPQAVRVRDRLFEVVEKDIAEDKKGRIYVGDYYIEGVITANSKKDYLHSDYMVLDLIFSTEFPVWQKDVVYLFTRDNVPTVHGEGLKYPYRYPYRYGIGKNLRIINNESFLACDFEMIIYGPVTNPSISIGDNTYSIKTILGQNEYMLVNSIEKEITRYKPNGKTENEFANKVQKVFFKKIPPGKNAATANCFFDLTLKEKRGEPPWNL